MRVRFVKIPPAGACARAPLRARAHATAAAAAATATPSAAPPLLFSRSQGKGQLISNINACQAVAEAVRTTLGPRGMDKLIHDGTKVRARSAPRADLAL